MQLWRSEFKLDGINSGSWYHSLLFYKFLVNSTLILNLTMSPETQSKDVSNGILYIQKYCQLFIHESNTFLLNNAPFKPMG